MACSLSRGCNERSKETIREAHSTGNIELADQQDLQKGELIRGKKAGQRTPHKERSSENLRLCYEKTSPFPPVKLQLHPSPLSALASN